MKVVTQNTILLIASIFTPLALTEIALRIRYYNVIAKMSEDRWSYRYAKPPAYKKSPFYNVDFLKESLSSVKFNNNYTLQMMSGKYFNVSSDGFRTTINPNPESNKIRNIYMFGGSTIFSQEVPDSLTIPSILSSLISKNCVNNFKIHNRGIPSYRAKEQVSLLRKETLLTKDIVIFYDGFNDFHYNVHRNNPFFKSQFELIEQSSLIQKIVENIHRIPILNKSAILNFSTGRLTNSPKARNKTIQLVNKASSHYWNNIADAQKITHFSKAEFIHFMQPLIYHSILSKSESNYLIDHPTISSAGESNSYLLHFNRFKNHSKAQIGNDFKSIDLSKVLASYEASEIFLDHVHINEVGNQIIAENILANLVSVLKLNCMKNLSYSSKQI